MANTSNLDLVKPAGTDHALISVINSNMDKVDAYAGKVNTSLAGVEDGLAIVATGNTHAAITAGQFVYVKEHNTLPEGLYTASSNIAANATLSTTNLTADSKGGLNALSEQIGTLNSNITKITELTTSGNNGLKAYQIGKIVAVIYNSTLTGATSVSVTAGGYTQIGTLPSGIVPNGSVAYGVCTDTSRNTGLAFMQNNKFYVQSSVAMTVTYAYVIFITS